MTEKTGKPVWYELTTAPGALSEAGAFYAQVLGWEISESGMEDVTYHLARADGGMVAGLMEPPAPEIPPGWLTYFAVTDCDLACDAIRDAGGALMHGPQEVPGTGRFALCADPQGAAFGILESAPMEDGEGSRALARGRPGHAAWNELMTSDPEAALEFYEGLFGWEEAEALNLGDGGLYQTLTHDGVHMGAIMGLGKAPHPAWMTYFDVENCIFAMERIVAAGGAVRAGPFEAPADLYVAIATDPQGVWFAVLGPR
ncbi:MAG: glyoxalase/bleomycin resistance/extradiol dioxygenase family protein [Rhodobacterales bacterium]|nr:MAG: glyoxalase/bleomycin resistance/extradiol dioxygenase family protein [Rhodobacterales bacterium]